MNIKKSIKGLVALALAGSFSATTFAAPTNAEIFDMLQEMKQELKALKAENDLVRIEVEARQFEAQSFGIAEANIAEAKGEAEAINIINQALANNPYYLEWLKIQKWDGILPLVTGGDGATPFIEIPTNNQRP